MFKKSIIVLEPTGPVNNHLWGIPPMRIICTISILVCSDRIYALMFANDENVVQLYFELICLHCVH
jgi:hypothetical protein